MYKINEKYPNYKIYDNGIITDLNDKPLKVFTKCGSHHDRDTNAAINILRKAIEQKQVS